MGLTDLKSFFKLQALARNPFDLTQAKALSFERISKYILSQGDFKLFYSLERVDGPVIDSLLELAKESKALDLMRKQQSGEEMNVFEKRAVLHTAVRDFFDHPATDSRAKKETHDAFLEIEKLKAFLLKEEKQFDYLVHIGIGGSYLGPEVVFEGLKNYSKKQIRPFFIANVDPDEAFQVLKEIDLKKTLIVVVSKSGSTIETSTNEMIFRQAFLKANLKAEKHIIAVTVKKSQMDDKKRYKEVFYFSETVGGRFSVSSMVGAVTLSFVLGFDLFWEFLRGAHQMDLIALEKEEKNLPLFLALLNIWKRNFLKLPTLAVIPYSSALKKFSLYLQQLEMESNGKAVLLSKAKAEFATAPFLFGDSGSNAQHSFFQMLHQSADVSSQEFIGFKKSQLEEDLKVEGTTSQQKLYANLLGSALALACGKKDSDLNRNFNGNRPTSILLADKLTPKVLGQLISLYEHKTAFEGYIWGINSFDQEGVKLGKKISNQFLDVLQKKSSDGISSAFLKEF